MTALIKQIVQTDKNIVQTAINFFTAETTNPKLFERIKEVCIPLSNQNNKLNGESLINGGYLSLVDFREFIHSEKLTKGYKVQHLEHVVMKLLEVHILNPLPEIMTNASVDRRFKAGGAFAKFLYDRDLIFNLICGWEFIIEKYSNSVFKIENKDKNGDFFIGTGFYFGATDGVVYKELIVTNKHVVEGAKKIKIFNKDDVEIFYNTIVTDPERDLAFIKLKEALHVPTFHFYPKVDILSEIITIGYPSVPMSKFAYQLCHKGEVNSFIEDYMNNKLFLFSAKTSSGNSGSPVIDKLGMIVGIVTEELFEKEQFATKGKLPYNAAIPTDEIIQSINTYT